MDIGYSLVLPLAGLALTAYIIRFAFRAETEKAEAQRDVQVALLDKFSSGEEMTRFISTEEGKVLMDQLAAPSNNDPRRRLVGVIIGGCVMLSLSVAFFVLSSVFDGQLSRFLVIPAVVTGALSLGLFLGGFATYRLSAKLGLIRSR